MMSTRRRCAKTLIITDDEEVKADEHNPFSFREFLRCKNQDQEQDRDQEQEQDQDQTRQKLSSSHRLFDSDAEPLTFDPDFQSYSLADDPLSQSALQANQEEDGKMWAWTFQSAVSESSSSSPVCIEEQQEDTRFSSKPEVVHRGEGAKNSERSQETSTEGGAASRRSSVKKDEIQQLKEENMLLRRTIKELKRKTEDDQRRVAELSEELVQRRSQEVKEAQDLEHMVQSVEQNLRLMTKRALKAENSLSKLKAELQQLQAQVEVCRLENESLKLAESEVIVTMRDKAKMASEYLSKTANHAHSSIQQLLGEAESLRLVSQLLQSIDKISNLNAES